MTRETAETLPNPNDSQTGSLKTQIYQLLPRHTVFQVKLTLHRLENVPQIQGRFLTKWKFKNVQSMGPTNIFSRKSNGKGKDPAHHTLYPSKSQDDNNPTTAPNIGQFLIPTIRLPSSPPTPSPDYVAEVKGYTATKNLENYIVVWEETVTAAVQFNIKRENSYLLPNELKLVVRQEIDEPGSEETHSQFGFRDINLSEYVNEGPVTRRYLLQNGKTNATLRATLDVTYISGDKNYIKPPLPRDVLLADVHGLISHSHKPSPNRRALSGQSISPTPSARTRMINNDSPSAFPSSPMTRLPFSHFQPHAFSHYAISKQDTIDIIEAIFNPFQPQPLHKTEDNSAISPETLLDKIVPTSPVSISASSEDSSYKRISIDSGKYRWHGSRASASGSSSSASIADSKREEEDEQKGGWWRRFGASKSRDPPSRRPTPVIPPMTGDAATDSGPEITIARPPRKDSGKLLERHDMPWSRPRKDSAKMQNLNLSGNLNDPVAMQATRNSAVQRPSSSQGIIRRQHTSGSAGNISVRNNSPGATGPDLIAHVSTD